MTWRMVVNIWSATVCDENYLDKTYNPATIKDYISMMNNWTKQWLDRPATELTRGDGREVLNSVLEKGKTKAFQKRLKNTINMIYCWAMALLTGMRNGELYALKWEDIDLDSSMITVQRSFNKRENNFKSTKAGYWRTVPISSELKSLIIELRNQSKSEFVLQGLPMWRKGLQAKILKIFCKSIGLPEIKFHTQRACFATQLIGSGVEPIKVPLRD